MAAARRNTRQLVRRIHQRMLRQAATEGAGGINNNPAGNVEVVDLVDSSDGEGLAGQEDEEEVVVDPEDEIDEIDDAELEEAPFQTCVDFVGDDSLGNLTVKSFLEDCCKHPKIICHKMFGGLRAFMEEATGFKFQLPEDCPFDLDHEDDTFCVDRGDKWLLDLKERLRQQKRKDEEGAEQRRERREEDNEEEDENKYYWARITVVQKKNDLGLTVFRWTPLPMSEMLLGLYVKWCRDSYKPPPPKKQEEPSTSTSTPTSSGRKKRTKGGIATRRSLRNKESADVEEMEVDEEEEKELPKGEMSLEEKQNMEDEEEEYDGVDGYIKSFVRVVDLETNVDVEDRLRGDYLAREQRQREGKVEPKYSRELSNLISHNKVLHTPLVQTTSKSRRPRPQDDSSDSDDDNSRVSASPSSSASSKHSADSDYVCGGRAPKRVRKPCPKRYRTRSPRKDTATTTTATPAISPIKIGMLHQLRKTPVVVLNGLGMMLNGTINQDRPESSASSVISGASSKSASPSSSLGSMSVSGSSVSSPSKRKTKIVCDACRPPKEYATRKALYRHLTKKHCTSRELSVCECGIQIRKERLEFHKRYCKKAMLHQGNDTGRKG